MKISRSKSKNESLLFWRDAYLAGGQVTFGVAAAIWFLPPFDSRKIGVLLLNALATVWLILRGLKIAKKL